MITMKSFVSGFLFLIILNINHTIGSAITCDTELKGLTANDATSDDYFGYSVGISNNIAIVGSYQNRAEDEGGEEATSGTAYIYEKNNIDGLWYQTQKLSASDATYRDRFGFSVSISDNTAIIGSTGDDDKGWSSGSAYIFEKNEITDEWEQITNLM